MSTYRSSGPLPGALPPRDYTLRGRRLLLERVGPGHVDFLLDSFKDQPFWHHYRANQPRRLTRDKLLTSLGKEHQSSPDKLRKLEWVVFRVSEGQRQPIGLACLADYMPATKKAEFLLGIIAPAQRTHGTALEASLLVMDFSFNVAKLNKLVSYVYADNPIAQANTEALGFVQEGTLREHVYNRARDSYLSVHQNGLLAREFRANDRLGRLSRRLLQRDVTQPAKPQAQTGKSTKNIEKEKQKDKETDGWVINTSIDYL